VWSGSKRTRTNVPSRSHVAPCVPATNLQRTARACTFCFCTPCLCDGDSNASWSTVAGVLARRLQATMAARFGAVLRAMMSSMPSGRFTGGAVVAAGGLAATAYGVNASLYNGAWTGAWLANATVQAPS